MRSAIPITSGASAGLCAISETRDGSTKTIDSTEKWDLNVPLRIGNSSIVNFRDTVQPSCLFFAGEDLAPGIPMDTSNRNSGKSSCLEPDAGHGPAIGAWGWRRSES